MMSRALALASCALLPLLSVAQEGGLPAGSRFVMSHFGGDNGGGDERLYISASMDGLRWTALNNGQPVWQPPGWAPFGNVVRDPTITFARGLYWVAYTSGNYGAHASFGLVKSADLLNWTFVGEISTALPGATDPLTWNPAFFEDGDGALHVFVSISPINGSQYNPTPAMRSYELHPLNADFTQWSAPALVALPSTNTNELWVWKEGAIYHALYVDFTNAGAQYHVTSTSLLTGWSNRQFIGYNSQEGGFVLPKSNGGYRLYLEPGNSANPPGYRTCDFREDFTQATPQVRVEATVPMRNGKPTAARATQTFAMWQAAKLSTQPAAARGAEADPDHDGIGNALECVLDTDPLAPTALATRFSLLTAEAEGGRFSVLRFFRLRNFTDVNLAIERSIDLLQWEANPPSLLPQSITLMSDGTERVQLRGAAPLSGNGAEFFRASAVVTSVASPSSSSRKAVTRKRAATRRH